jgi:hypothetical protein
MCDDVPIMLCSYSTILVKYVQLYIVQYSYNKELFYEMNPTDPDSLF